MGEPGGTQLQPLPLTPSAQGGGAEQERISPQVGRGRGECRDCRGRDIFPGGGDWSSAQMEVCLIAVTLGGCQIERDQRVLVWRQLRRTH